MPTKLKLVVAYYLLSSIALFVLAPDVWRYLLSAATFVLGAGMALRVGLAAQVARVLTALCACGGLHGVWSGVAALGQGGGVAVLGAGVALLASSALQLWVLLHADVEAWLATDPHDTAPQVRVVRELAPADLPGMMDPRLAGALGFLFGPVGLVYASGTGALGMLIVAAVATLMLQGLGLAISFGACAAWGYLAARDHNLDLAERAHRRRVLAGS